MTGAALLKYGESTIPNLIRDRADFIHKGRPAVLDIMNPGNHYVRHLFSLR